MIYCPKCGTANREGSKFCNECGAPLPATGLRCPMCGAINPVGNVYCDRCGARLIQAGPPQPPEEGKPERTAPIKGISLPSITLEEKTGEDWLSELRAATAEIGSEAPAEEEEIGPVEIPPWLAGTEPAPLGPSAVPEEPSPKAPATPEEPAPIAEMPDWLRELGAPKAPTAPEEPAPVAEMPDWLRELGAPKAPTAPEEPAPIEEMPDWLRELGAPKAPTAPEEPAPIEEMPDWLRELGVPKAPVTPEEPAPIEEMPDWLRELAGPISPEGTPSGPPPFIFEGPMPPSAPPEEGAPTLAPGEIPDWLKSLEPVSPATERPSEYVPPVLPDTSAEATSAEQAVVPPLILEEEETTLLPTEAEVPDWLKRVSGEEKPAAAPPTDFGGLVPAEIPEWLRAMRPREEEVVAEEPMETEGLLAGLVGLLPIGSGLDMPATAKPMLPQGPSPAARARAELLQGLLSRPMVMPRAVPQEAPRKGGWTLARLLVGLVLIAAIVAPMVIRLPLFGQPAAPGAAALFTMIGQLPPNAPVLVAWEYGPAEAEEMDRVAGPLIDHLLRQEARLVVVSTRMEGPASAEALIAPRLADIQERPRRIANLGYVPGQTAGVREVIGNLDGRTEVSTGLPAAQVEAMAGVHSIADVAMVVVLAAQPDDLRVWVEQVSSAAPRVPIVGGLSARAELMAAPYLSAGQMRGAISGLVGGAAYERQLDTGRGREYEYYLTSLGLAQWAVVALAAIGALIFAVGGRKR